MITSTKQILDVSSQPSIAAVNLAFSQRGFDAMKIIQTIDFSFKAGQAADAPVLGEGGELVTWLNDEG